MISLSNATWALYLPDVVCGGLTARVEKGFHGCPAMHLASGQKGKCAKEPVSPPCPDHSFLSSAAG